MIDYAWVLSKGFPGKQWSMNGESYEGIIWHDELPIPKEELDAKYIELKEKTQLIEAEKKEMPSEKEMLEAMWKKVVEGDSVDVDALQAERLRVKEKYKK